MAHLKSNCSKTCQENPKSCWHHPRTSIVRQFLNGNWLIENPKGFVRLAATNELQFKENEYGTHKDPNAFVRQYAPDNPFEADDPRRDLWETIQDKRMRR